MPVQYSNREEHILLYPQLGSNWLNVINYVINYIIVIKNQLQLPCVIDYCI